ncbi:MAG: UDP-N-acetylmuramoyl-L-alanine--D-glutamate ligase [Deltaproteobacteria bacterium]|nr:UDP-N-acetylmuramoyl-L-alanine--D-glutamate ligase [Deltaproteobacteria bacterium]
MKRAASVFSGRKTLVVGLASTGLSCSRFLAKCGASVVATDMKPASSLPGVKALVDMGVDVRVGGHIGINLKDIETVVVSPGVPYDQPILVEARVSGAEVISDMELAYRFIDSSVIAVAGTNGKSTTTTLIGRMIEDAGHTVFTGGNLGTPAIEYVETGLRADFCVLEVSSFHLETTKDFNPHIGALLNITEDHLERYDGFDHYARTKFRLFENQTPGDWAIVNLNDPVIARRAKTNFGKGRRMPFTSAGVLKEGVFLRGGDIVYVQPDRAEEIYPTAGFKLKGSHNVENIMAAIAAARLSGVEKGVIVKTLKSFTGLPHRMELVRELNGVAYIDDSKGTNVGALDMALRGINGRVILIAGGRDKGGDYKALSKAVKEKVKFMVLIGEARFKMKDSLGGFTDTVLANRLEEAVSAAHTKAAVGDTVLLCPACSSFDMFKDYKERGDEFKRLVAALR